jgi:hypothetical protein
MKYSELSEQEKRIWDQVYALSFVKNNRSAMLAINDANSAIYQLRIERNKE